MTKGELEQIRIGPGDQFTHQLFVDDIGLFLAATKCNFQVARGIIAKYEAISGASLNLSKFIIFTLYLKGEIPIGFAKPATKLLIEGGSDIPRVSHCIWVDSNVRS